MVLVANNPIEISELKKFLRSFVLEVSGKREELQTIAANEAEAYLKQRIFVYGLDIDLNLISKSYSKNTLYINPKRVDKLLPKTKLNSLLNKQPKKKNGKARKTVKFTDGYEGFRKAVNRKVDKVDVDLTSTLRDSIQVGEFRGSPALGIVSEDMVDRAGYLEEKYDKEIFGTDIELIDIIDELVDEKLDEYVTAFFD